MEEFEVSDASKKTKTIYISTIFSITLVLLMLGVLGLILVHAKNLSNYVKENIVLNIIVDEGAKEADVLQFQKELNANPAVKQTQYVNKELAARNLTQDLGEDFVNFLGYNPLLSTVDVYLKAEYANIQGIDTLKAQIGKNPVVKEVIYQSSLIEMVNKNINTIGLIILAFAAILLVISIALINNTIRLAIYSQRFLIKSMQLVGATKNFIRKPFILLAMLHGLIASIIAVTLLMGLLFYAQREIPEIVILRNYTEFGIVLLFLVGIGIFITAFSTSFAVSRYLRLKTYDLYR
ncbi:cell division protein FtsX [Pedobacter antarcticus]|uniref:Cell division protein FtsX n=2 Tax=Pedobacter antarcticus TaxID=34086 RepID=A0A081PLP2_9SPHI|nr:permease-like cell division protein FtsX [Pedobacter antarcticus]KEQ31615.1 cell division protein FtsX [Pedobacter antarcticus 4BY]SDM63790.1 cell division transport system permease protein [Pedobacter antarcticus]SFF35216.1 cell division transport system permease protein [Pedobacter antarcticus]